MAHATAQETQRLWISTASELHDANGARNFTRIVAGHDVHEPGYEHPHDASWLPEGKAEGLPNGSRLLQRANPDAPRGIFLDHDAPGCTSAGELEYRGLV